MTTAQTWVVDCNGLSLDLSQPRVMGIINLGAESFCAIGRVDSPQAALQHAKQIVKDGAAIIDIGAEPTHPSLTPNTTAQQELDRLIPTVELLSQQLDVLLSVDTSRPEVMTAAIQHGAHMINDVRALRRPNALATVAQLGVPVCLMHMNYPEGVPEDAASNPAVTVQTIKDFLQQRIQACLDAGIAREKILIDPGIGHGNFGKNLAENLTIIAQLAELQSLQQPLLIGVSRKTFVGELLNVPTEQRLAGSLAATVSAVHNGARLIRAHDVKATVDAIKMALAIQAHR